MLDQLTFLIIEYPVIKTILAVIVTCRLVFKPLMSIVSKYVELTVTKDDDKKLHKIMDTTAYKMLAYLVDYTTSLKIPRVK